MNNNKTPISVIIPIYPPHLKFIPSLIKNMNEQTLLPDEVILCISEISLEDSQAILEKHRHNSKFELVIHGTHEKQNQSQNRNRGILIAKHKFVMNCDADDIIHHEKIEIMKYILGLRPHTNLICHNYFYNRHKIHDKSALNFSVNLKNLFLHADSNKYSQDTKKKMPCTNISIENYPVHHGHVLFNKECGVFYREENGIRNNGEDGQFCQDILFRHGNIVYIEEKLMLYN
jgi:glycosyltransferase involved in cell wall biosynthesis